MPWEVRKDWGYSYERELDTRVLSGTLDLLERGWAQREGALKADLKTGVDALSDEACAWCLTAAMFRVVCDLGVRGWRGEEVIWRLCDRMARGLPKGFERTYSVRRLVAYNDAVGRTKAEILDLVRKALAEVRGGT